MVDSGIEANTEEIGTKSPFLSDEEEYNQTCIEQGLLLPFILYEGTWDPYLRGFLYILGLMYCLFGVTVVSDVFMGAIERITTQAKKKKKSSHEGEAEMEETAIWNETIANLTLISLAVSAPEILLAAVEVFAFKFKAGELGSGTLIGCSGLQLLLIPALCSLFIPKGALRPVRSFKVFLTISIFSIIGFIWLFVTVDFISANVVEIWEAILFPYFLIVLLLAWLVGRNWNKKKNENLEHRVVEQTTDQNGTEVEMMLKPQDITIVRSAATDDKEVLLNFYKNLRHIPDISDTDVSALIAAKLNEMQLHSRLWYRIDAIRRMTGSKRLHPTLSKNQKEMYRTVTELMNINPENSRPPTRQDDFYVEKTVVEFKHDYLSITKNVGKFNISVIRHGRLDNTARVRVESYDGTAKQGRHYTHVNKQLAFGPYIKEKEVTVLIDEDKWKPELEFFLKMTMVDEEYYRDSVRLGKSTVMEIRGVESSDQIFRHTKCNQVYYENYKAQFQGMLKVNGGNIEGVNCFDWSMHVILFPWKLIASLIPPAGYLGGWLCAEIAPLLIGLIAVLIGDFAKAFSCVAEFDVYMMAILFIPLGFGLPDIIVSKFTAACEKSGDVAISYLAGTNLFRVAIGLGLPWLISSVYQEINEQTFIVNSGNFSFSVLVYSCAALLALLFLVIRKFVPLFGKSELGGSTISNWLTAFILFFLWETFVVVVSLRVFNVIMWEWREDGTEISK